MIQHFKRMAAYNKWAYQTLFTKVNQLSPQQYIQHEPLFSHSVHGTLCHLLLAEKLWYSRMTGTPLQCGDVDVNSLWQLGGSNGGLHWANAIPDNNKDQLQNMILEQTDKWIHYVDSLDESVISNGGQFTYYNTKNVELKGEISAILDHVFNHSTHHRGQISTLVMKHLGGENAPEMDLLYFIRKDS